MARTVRKIVKTKYYYDTCSESESESESSDSDDTTVIFDDDDWKLEESESEGEDNLMYQTPKMELTMRVRLSRSLTLRSWTIPSHTLDKDSEFTLIAMPIRSSS